MFVERRLWSIADRYSLRKLFEFKAAGTTFAPYPHDDIWNNLERVFDAWGLDRCLWGTDWTRTYPLFPYINGVDPFRLNQRLSESDKAKLMGETCATVYGWKPKSSFRQRHPKGRND